MDKIPLCDLAVGYFKIEDEVLASLREVLRTQNLILGENVRALEAQIAKYSGVQHALGVASGSDALLLALMALDLKPGQFVVTTAYSFFATAGAISRLGGIPLFADIDADTFNISPKRIEELVQEYSGKDIRAIIPVHLFGQCADMDAIGNLARKRGVAVIEDAAQAMGACWQHQKAGSLGDVGCFSFFPSKNLGGFGDGGMCVTSRDDLAARIRMLRSHGSKTKYYHDCIGINSRLDEIQACILRIKMRELDASNALRFAKAQHYHKLIHDAGLEEWVKTPTLLSAERQVFHQYVIKAQRRDVLKTYLDQVGIGNAIYYPIILPQQKCYTSHLQASDEFPVAQVAAATSLALPMFPELSASQQEYVVDHMVKFYRGL